MRAAVKPAIEKFSANIGPDFVKSFYAEIDKARKTGWGDRWSASLDE